MRLSIALLVLFLASSLPSLAQDVGMVYAVKGKPEVSVLSKGWEPLRLFRRLQEGAKIKCGAGSEVIVVIFGRGERFRVPSGKSADVTRMGMPGAVSLGGLKGPSERAAQLLAGSRVGASVSRGITRGSEATILLSRPSKDFPGWLELNDRHLKWTPMPGAVTYWLAVYDKSDILLWSIDTAETAADIPANINLEPRKPYVWRINARTGTGAPVEAEKYRWGVLTWLSPEDIKELTDLEQALDTEIQAKPSDPLPRLLLAAKFRAAGVLTRTWEVIDEGYKAHALSSSERSQALLEVLNEISGFVWLSGQLQAEGKPDEHKQP